MMPTPNLSALTPSRPCIPPCDRSRQGFLAHPKVLMHERDDLLKRLLGSRGGEIAGQTFALPLNDGQVDLATSAAVLQDELIEVRARMRLLVPRARHSTGGIAVRSPRARMRAGAAWPWPLPSARS